jgi:hypothetical protein
MSDELLNLSNELLKNEDLDIEAHAKTGADESAEGKDEGKDEGEVEAHLLNEDLLEL